jgi:hypothetical protein
MWSRKPCAGASYGSLNQKSDHKVLKVIARGPVSRSNARPVPGGKLPAFQTKAVRERDYPARPEQLLSILIDDQYCACWSPHG